MQVRKQSGILKGSMQSDRIKDESEEFSVSAGSNCLRIGTRRSDSIRHHGGCARSDS